MTQLSEWQILKHHSWAMYLNENSDISSINVSIFKIITFFGREISRQSHWQWRLTITIASPNDEQFILFVRKPLLRPENLLEKIMLQTLLLGFWMHWVWKCNSVIGEIIFNSTQTNSWEWGTVGCNSVAGHVPSTHKALGLSARAEIQTSKHNNKTTWRQVYRGFGCDRVSYLWGRSP